MKVFIVGATGVIGGEILYHCLRHPEITSVVSFSRRPLPASISQNAKLSCAIVPDFSRWPVEVLIQHADAAAMIW